MKRYSLLLFYIFSTLTIIGTFAFSILILFMDPSLSDFFLEVGTITISTIVIIWFLVGNATFIFIMRELSNNKFIGPKGKLFWSLMPCGLIVQYIHFTKDNLMTNIFRKTERYLSSLYYLSLFLLIAFVVCCILMILVYFMDWLNNLFPIFVVYTVFSLILFNFVYFMFFLPTILLDRISKNFEDISMVSPSLKNFPNSIFPIKSSFIYYLKILKPELEGLSN